MSRQSGEELTTLWTASIVKAERERTGVNAKSMDIMRSETPNVKGQAEVQFDLNQANPASSADTDYIADGLKLEEEQ